MMEDFYTLEAVLDHYSSGVVNTQNLDESLNNNGTLGIPLYSKLKKKKLLLSKKL